jgi:molybdopterin-containing oxidoreductase family membrane subunit
MSNIAAQPHPSMTQPSLADLAVRPMVHAGRGFWLVALLAAVVAGVGAVAYAVQLTSGLGVTGLNDQVFWGMYEATLVTFIGFSYGGALVSAILRLVDAPWRGRVTRIAEATALATLLVGALFPIIHLGRPERVLLILFQPNFESPIVWDLVAISTYIVATVILFGLPLIADLAILSEHPELGPRRRRILRRLSFGWRGTPKQRRTLERALTVIAILIVPLAVIVHTVLSYAFSLTSRPGWHSTIFGPYFVIGAVYSGVAIVILTALAYRRAYGLREWIDDRVIRNLGYVLVALAVAYGYVTFTEITTEGYVSEPAEAGILYSLVFAHFAPLFWAFVGCGLVVPLVVMALPRFRTGSCIGLASAGVIVAMFIKRVLIIVPAEAQPLIGGATGAYSPSWVELAIVAGGGGGIVLILLVIFRLVPVLAIHEIGEIEGRAEEPARAASAATLEVTT